MTLTVLTSTAQLFILNLVVSNPGIYLIMSKANDEYKPLQYMQILHESGFTHQKLRCVVLQQDILLREQFAVDVHHFTPLTNLFSLMKLGLIRVE